MRAHHLRAPAADGALLAQPPLADAGATLLANAARLDAWDHDFQGRRASTLRPAVRAQVLDRARVFAARLGLETGVPAEAPAHLVVTGHQPELFHPGVWVKNFATSAIARADGQALALNLVVDNDTPKSADIRVPYLAGDRLGVTRLPFDDWAGELPYEDLAVRDEARFAGFADRVRETMGSLADDPVLDDFWPRAVAARAATDRVGLRFAAARHAVEAGWGVRNVEVPLSAICESDSFLWFASHLLAQLPRFQEVHNAALDRYRAIYGIRSRHHPVPALATQGDWLEAPFWAWRASNPRRRPLLARQLSRTMQLRIAGEDDVLAEIPLAPDREACCAVEQLAGLPGKGVRLRTRALTTTMFARLLLGDIFLHGIGGAKYDELGDEIVRRFFGFEPPAYLTLSMTLWLGLPDAPGAENRLRGVNRFLRDLTFNPDRHLDGLAASADAAALVEAKRAAVAGPQTTHRERKERFAAIRRCNEALQEWVEAERTRVQSERESLAEGAARNSVAHSREYASVLHPRGKLRAALARAVPGLWEG